MGFYALLIQFALTINFPFLFLQKSLREWSIPFSDLQVGEIVGVGPKGNVHK